MSIRSEAVCDHCGAVEKIRNSIFGMITGSIPDDWIQITIGSTSRDACGTLCAQALVVAALTEEAKP